MWAHLCCLICLFSFSALYAQRPVDSIKVRIELNPKDIKIEMAKNYQSERAGINLQMDMFGFRKGQKYRFKTFDFHYITADDAWEVTLPKGFFQLRVESLGFKDFVFPFRLKEDFTEEFNLEVDSLPYTYKDGESYPYIANSLAFSESILVYFKSGDWATNRALLDELLDVEGMEHVNVRRAQKIKDVNAFIVNLNIRDQTALTTLIHNKLTQKESLPWQYQISNVVTEVLETYQANEAILYANPTFIDDATQTYRPSTDFPKSDQLTNKLERMMTEDENTLQKINYIVNKTTPPVVEEE